jgi:hypothetical protein
MFELFNSHLLASKAAGLPTELNPQYPFSERLRGQLQALPIYTMSMPILDWPASVFQPQKWLYFFNIKPSISR